MAKKFKLGELKRMIPEMRKILDEGQRNSVIAIRDELVDACPYETGRLASSWRIGQGKPNRDVEPERDEPGEVTLPPDPERIPYGPPVYISSNIPYAERLALGYRTALALSPRDLLDEGFKGAALGQELRHRRLAVLEDAWR